MRSQRDSADGLLSLSRVERHDRIVAGTPAARDAQQARDMNPVLCGNTLCSDGAEHDAWPIGWCRN